MTQQMKSQMQKKRGKGGLYFLAIMVIAYIILFVLNSPKVGQALKISAKLIVQIIPVLIFVVVIIALLDYFLKPQKIKKVLGKESGMKGWIIAITFGIISHGSVYAWYPLLKELKTHGMRDGLIAAFIYNRAIKIPFIPLMIYYFGLKFFIVITMYMIVTSVIEGWLIEKI